MLFQSSSPTPSSPSYPSPLQHINHSSSTQRPSINSNLPSPSQEPLPSGEEEEELDHDRRDRDPHAELDQEDTQFLSLPRVLPISSVQIRLARPNAPADGASARLQLVPLGYKVSSYFREFVVHTPAVHTPHTPHPKVLAFSDPRSHYCFQLKIFAYFLESE